MNLFLWILQGLLAVHTLVGAIWKFSNAETAVETLSMIPHPIWTTLSFFEILCAIALILPVFKKFSQRIAVLAAVGIAGEMLLFSLLHVNTGTEEHNPMFYWLGVFVVCVVVAIGRLKVKR